MKGDEDRKAAEKYADRYGTIDTLIRRKRIMHFLAGSSWGRAAALKECLEMLKSKAAMGFELDAGMRSGDCELVVDFLKTELKRMREEIHESLARMREITLKRHPEWLGGMVSDVLECCLCIEKDYADLERNLALCVEALDAVSKYFSAMDLPSHCVTIAETMRLGQIARSAVAGALAAMGDSPIEKDLEKFKEALKSKPLKNRSGI